jgi:hypothetical protein
MIKKFIVLSFASAISVNGWAATDPSSVTIKVYGIALSANADCSSATVVGYNAAGTDYDFKAAPALFSGAIASGTYKCVVLYMSPIINFKPLASTGSCTAGTSYHINVCNSDQNNCTYTTASPNASNVLVYGANAAATGLSTATTTSDKILLFLSTGSTGTGNNAFQQPLAATPSYGIKLSGAFTVSDSGSAGTFVVNFNNQVDGSQASCGLNAPTFSFR